VIYKLLATLLLLLFFILTPYNHERNKHVDDGVDVHFSTEINTSGFAWGPSSTTFFLLVQRISWAPHLKRTNRYSKYMIELLDSYIPLLKTNNNLITIKFQSTFSMLF